jgi:hypothetical protein
MPRLGKHPDRKDKMLGVRCTEDQRRDVIHAAHRLGYAEHSEAIRALMRWIATADADVVAAIKGQL